MYGTILVPLDGSERAEVILSHVIELAKKFSAKVILLEAVEQKLIYTGDLEISGTAAKADDELAKQTKNAESYIAGVKGKLEQQNIQVTTRIMQGPPVEAIIAMAKQENADLIAMASHGRSGIGRVFYGSVAAGILHRVDRPLLIIRSSDL
ncbi:MAG: universal stress protein [Proteobacteria bacterium]|nr:universal stress protein [Pseudomonadota bacterium]MBU4298160.1 universal stress protein [Pseudomonadota bacterium]MCG2748362.1 universal stress protein [Desulfobulbaceae bacterium]